MDMTSELGNETAHRTTRTRADVVATQLHSASSMARKKWMLKPFRNWPGVVPKPVLGSPRRVQLELLPRVQQLVAGGVMAKPVWLDAVSM